MWHLTTYFQRLLWAMQGMLALGIIAIMLDSGANERLPVVIHLALGFSLFFTMLQAGLPTAQAWYYANDPNSQLPVPWPRDYGVYLIPTLLIYWLVIRLMDSSVPFYSTLGDYGPWYFPVAGVGFVLLMVLVQHPAHRRARRRARIKPYVKVIQRASEHRLINRYWINR